MSFQPVIPLSGLAGWAFLNRTMDTQKTAFEDSTALKRDTDYFRAKIADVASAEDLVSDRRLMRVALGAFGLGDDINNTYFIKKVLEDGTADPEALGNKLADKRYLALAETFGFDDGSDGTNRSAEFADRIIDRFHSRQFEIAVGNQNEDLRLALNVERELDTIVGKPTSENTKWFSIMGNPPLRSVFETALNLPTGTAQLDLDQQLTIFKDQSTKLFGSADPTVFSASDTRDDLIQQFLLRSQIANGQASLSSASIALTLLGG